MIDSRCELTPDILVLLEGLVEGKDDLAVGETVQGHTLLLHPLHRPFLNKHPGSDSYLRIRIPLHIKISHLAENEHVRSAAKKNLL